MKILTKFILIIVFLTTTFSCNKFMDILPPDGLTRDEFWNTKEEVQEVIMGTYATFAQLDQLMFKYGEMRADMVTSQFNMGDADKLVMIGNIYPDNSLCNWSSFYKVINYCNEVIKNAPLVKNKDNTFTDFQLKGYLSEAYFLRSLSYFYLVRVFKDVPFVTEPSDADDVNFYIPKSDADTVLNNIVKDLIEYRKYATIDGYITMAENKGRATKGAFDALLADISLWRFDYESCITYVDNIIASAKYDLMPMDRFFELFYPGNSLESIFEFQFNPKLNQNNNLYGLTSQSSYNFYPPSLKAIDYYKKEALIREVKRGEDITIAKYSGGSYQIWKYAGMAPDGITTRSGTEQKGCNWIVYRYADVLLMKAEALSQIGRYTEALDILNDIHERAGFTSPIVLADSPSAYEDKILEERALELAYEGKRWFDLLRMGRRNNYLRKTKLIEYIIQNVASSQKRILATKLTNPLGWYMPIFKDEIERNKNLVQNPYYNTNL